MKAEAVDGTVHRRIAEVAGAVHVLDMLGVALPAGVGAGEYALIEWIAKDALNIKIGAR